MPLETAAIAALGAVTTALCFLFRLLWNRSQECEQWRKEKEPLIARMAKELGLHTGVSRLVNDCKTPNCPFAGTMVENLSLKKTP